MASIFIWIVVVLVNIELSYEPVIGLALVGVIPHNG